MASSAAPRVAIVGGGITGACAAAALAARKVEVHLYDQGRSGVGGRASRRQTDGRAWDHGCQFFRADTTRMKAAVQGWLQEGLCSEWRGNFTTDGESANFFGLPDQPPFYVGMKGLITALTQREGVTVFPGHRVSWVRHGTGKWSLFGTSGDAAFHDTTANADHALLGADYDAVLLTDLSSCFGTWHKASAGVPQAFADRVRARAGARVPLFTAMIAFDKPTGVPFDACAFGRSQVLWFAGRTGSKGGGGAGEGGGECWSLVSTPRYALDQITEVPMQDPVTGAFVPQDPKYLTTVPGPDLLAAFREAVREGWGVELPPHAFMNAQRWGSALPAHKGADGGGVERREISGVEYAAGFGPLAPTREGEGGGVDYVADEERMLFQAGDMVSECTPGFEAAALSGMDAAERMAELLLGTARPARGTGTGGQE